MKKIPPRSRLRLFLTAGIAQAQVVVRIGPPPRPHEVIPPPPLSIATGPGMVATIVGMATVTSGFPAAYERPPHPHARWVDGHWDHAGERLLSGSKATGGNVLYNVP